MMTALVRYATPMVVRYAKMAVLKLNVALLLWRCDQLYTHCGDRIINNRKKVEGRIRTEVVGHVKSVFV